MHPGEYVFIPKNTYHRITPLTDKRLSCSFPIHPESKKFDEREWLNI
jgi:quercetin dioxygenase-like cupin family protein